jgi:hypothetical protein
MKMGAAQKIRKPKVARGRKKKCVMNVVEYLQYL